MDQILKNIDSAFRLMSSIPVSGDNVDIMSAARNNLRRAYAELEKMNTKKETEKPNAKEEPADG